MNSFRTHLVCSAAVWALGAGAALAQSTTFALPAQPLSQSLDAVAHQTGRSILFMPQTVVGLRARALNGQMSAQDAVQTLLQGTDLEAAPDGDGFLVRVAAGAHRSEILQPRVMVAQAATPASDSPPPQPPAAPQDQAGIEQVVVSGSRINIADYSQPTPVTVVGLEQLQRDGFGDIIDSLQSIPQLQSNMSNIGATQTSTTSGNGGADLVNLRSLGNNRTLVLLDSQRFVITGFSTQSGYDIDTIPSAMISRVDIVTGGASAAWGSDAVAGVVNFIINKNFSGFKANIEASDTSDGLVRGLSANSAWGDDVFSGRGHVELAVSANFMPDHALLTQEGWFRGAYWVSNPAYVAGSSLPLLIVANNVGLANQTIGGIINSSPAGVAGPGVSPAATNALRGIQFVGGGIPQVVNYGNVTLGAISNGGSLTDANTQAIAATVANPRSTYNFFAYGRYKLTDTVQASIQLNANYTKAQNISNSGQQTAVVVRSDNAYIPASVSAIMQNGGVTSFTLGTMNFNNYSSAATGANFTSQNGSALGLADEFSHHLFARGVFTLEGEIGDDWSWKAYAQASETRYTALVVANPITSNVTAAEDAVTVTAANVGKTGLALGSIACRTTLTGTPVTTGITPNTFTAQPGCIPLNVFGEGVASPAALAYVSGATAGTPNHDNTKLEQDVIEASMQGTLPWGFPAGKIAVAFGTGYRKESGYQTSNPIGMVGGYVNNNFFALPDKSYNVLEGFGEAAIPVLKNNIVNSVDFSMAGRITSYSTSGTVETWKLGLTSQVNDDLMLRTTWSVDIRAPYLTELFSPGQVGQNSQRDPKTQATVSVIGITSGNPNLVPEVARTVSGGAVLTPAFIPGLNMSFDWYSINITGEITTLSATAIISQCNPTLPSVLYPGTLGNPNDPLCSRLIFAGPNGALSNMTNQQTNVAGQTTSGLDIQANYVMDFLDGTLAWATTDNYNDENTLNAPAAPLNDFAGSENFNGGQFAPGPKWRGVISATYAAGPTSFTVQSRWLGTSKYNNLANTGNLSSATLANLYDPAHFEIPAIAYLDLRGSYKWNDNIQFYGGIDNVLQTPPPLIPNSSSTTTYSVQIYDTNMNYYSLLGRIFRLGVRFNY